MMMMNRLSLCTLLQQSPPTAQSKHHHHRSSDANEAACAAGLLLLHSSKKNVLASGARRSCSCAPSARSRICSSGARFGVDSEHGGASHGHPRSITAAAARRFSPQSIVIPASCHNSVEQLDAEHAQESRSSKAEMDGFRVLEDEGGTLPPSNRESREPGEILLKGIRDGDFDGAPIFSQVWVWRHRWHIYYEKAGMGNTDAPALLLLPGFGVGSFHYEQQLRDLGQDYRVWAIDFLGQGSSWPSHDPAPIEEAIGTVVDGQAKEAAGDWGFGQSAEPWAQELVYSVDTWRDQVHDFVDKVTLASLEERGFRLLSTMNFQIWEGLQVIGEPVYVVGNSLGGYVGTYFAATEPKLVRGITLVNATPFWAFMPNARRYPLLARFVPWAGLLPVPAIAKALIRFWWDILRKPRTIQRMLELVYADRSAVNDKLVAQIVEATDHPAAAAAFASILFAPRAHTDFGENLIRLKEEKMPMCMIYGREDPWVVPFWGQRAKQRNPDAIYYELSPAGHCPHHEAPEIVNVLLRKWVESVASQGAVPPALHEEAGGKQQQQQQQQHWFVIEADGGQERRVSVRVKGHQGFFADWLDSIREMFSKQRLRTKVVMALEEMGD